jgi:hypothetical protein
VEHDYTFLSTDPDGDDIFYMICWGCCGSRDFHSYGPFESGVKTTLSHSWNKQGDFTIQAYAKDINEAESDTVTFEISMPRANLPQNIFFMRLHERFPNLFSVICHLFY